jgi:hypothetical protein
VCDWTGPSPAARPRRLERTIIEPWPLQVVSKDTTALYHTLAWQGQPLRRKPAQRQMILLQISNWKNLSMRPRRTTLMETLERTWILNGVSLIVYFLTVKATISILKTISATAAWTSTSTGVTAWANITTLTRIGGYCRRLHIPSFSLLETSDP